MVWSKTRAAIAVVVVGLAAVSLVQHRLQVRIENENQTLRQRVESLQGDNDRVTNLLAQANGSAVVRAHPSAELLRLRGETGMLHRQTNELQLLIAYADNDQPRHPASPREEAPLPADYPAAIADAAKDMFHALSGGDLEQVFTNFSPPGVSREKAEKTFALYFRDEQGNNTLAGVELLSLGEATNSYYGMSLGPNKWVVPCRLRLPDGSEEASEMLIGRDPGSPKWYFLGGLQH